MAPASARADRREELQLQGEQQAKDGRYADAIESFKQADRLQPRASHACLIALAYTRRELWSQAQLWLATCHQRASATDPLPDWVPLAEKQIQERLQTANVASVTIEVRPADANAKFWVSSFAPDEVFEPRTITLPFGTHVIFARLDGSDDAPRQHTLQISDKSPQRVVIDFADQPPAEVTGTTNLGAPVPETPHAPGNTLSNALLVGGGVALIGGGLSHLLMWRARKDMVAATDAYETIPAEDRTQMALDAANRDYEAAETKFDRWRPLAIGLYAVGAGAAITGYLIRKKHDPETASISAVPLPEGGGFVSVGWVR